MIQGPVRKKRIKIRTRQRLVVGVVVVVLAVLILGGGSLFLLSTSEESSQRQSEAQQNTTRQLASSLSGVLTAQRKALDAVASDPEVIDALASKNMQALASLETRLSTNFTDLLRLRLLPSDTNVPDEQSMPPFSFGSLDMVRRVINTGQAVDAEVHLLGGGGDHIAMAMPVLEAGEEGGVVGAAYISLDLSILKQAIARLSINDDYLEVVQPLRKGQPVLIGSTGLSSLKTSSLPTSSKVAGSSWQIKLWSTEAKRMSADSGEGDSSGLLFMALIGVVVVAAAGAGLVLFRRKKGDTAASPVDKDVTYTGAVKAIMDGEHPGLAKLVPSLKGKVREMDESDDVSPLSKGLQGDDITRIKVPAKDATPPVDPSAEMDLDLTAAAAEPMFDLTAEAESAETVAPEQLPVAEKASPAARATDGAASVFRAYDIRGIVGKTLTVELVYDIGRALGSESQKRGQKTMVVGRDGRHSGPDLIEALIRGLSETGMDVIDIGMVPTPVLYFATYFLETGSGVMVTGSHNPPDYNGLKMMIGGDTLFGEDITALYTRIQAGDFLSGSGSIEKADIGSEYIRRVTEDIPVALGNSYKVVVDCGNGVAGVMAPQLIRALGHDVVDLYCDVDGNFPNHHPDPSQPENLQALIAKVKETHADLGLAFDGDGDRLGVVDAEGHVIWPDRQMMLYAADVLSRNPGAEIIYDVKCSRHLRACIEEHGGKPLMWKTGHSFIKTKMKESGAPLAGEMSGHIFFKERWYGFDDAIYTAARLLEILLGLPGSPTEILSALPTGVTTPELRLDLSEDRHGPFMQQLIDNAEFENAEISHIDGLRADFPNGWGLIRASNTTPCLILRFEGDDEAAMKAIQEQFKALIQSLDDTLNIPF